MILVRQLQTPAAEVRAAYRECERITRQQAKNFSYGIALLPGDKRRALSAVYAFARRVDDIGDGSMPADDKIAALEQARSEIVSLQGGGFPGADSVLVALRDASARFGIPLGAFSELIDGCRADVQGATYATFGDLEHYCRCVAGSIGRLSLGVFGSSDPAAAEPLADSLGIAFQLTNIVRDIREDLANGRVYLPTEDIERFDCTITPGGPDGRGVLDGDLAKLITFETERAREWYATGLRLLPLLDRRSAASAGAMAGIYSRLLDHICASPQAALASRMSLPTSEKAMVAVSALAGMVRHRQDGAAPSRAGVTRQPRAGQP